MTFYIIKCPVLLCKYALLPIFFLAHSFYENTQETQPVMNTIVHWVFWDWPPTISARLCLLTFGTAAWKTNSVISASVELEAWMVMTATFGLGLALSNVKSIFRPFLLYAVIGGIPMWRFHSRPSQDLNIHFMESLMVMAKYFNTQAWCHKLHLGADGEQRTLTCRCNVIKQGLWGEAIQEERGLGSGHRGSRSRGWTAWEAESNTPGFKRTWTQHSEILEMASICLPSWQTSHLWRAWVDVAAFLTNC